MVSMSIAFLLVNGFDNVEDVNDFDILKNRLFKILGFLLRGHLLCSMENLVNLVDTLIDL